MIAPASLVQGILNAFSQTAATVAPSEIGVQIADPAGVVFTVHIAFFRHEGSCGEHGETLPGIRPSSPSHPDPSRS